MSSDSLFILSAIIVVIGIAAVVVPVRKWKEYFWHSSDGRGVLKGILLALLFGIVIAFSSNLFAEEKKWYVPEDGWKLLPEASVFLGMDYTKNISPMCLKGGVDDRWTSNLGVRLGIFETSDGKFNVASKYTHHSCAYGVDDSSYDDVGVELEYKIWER